jgi:hypothetical protein
MHLHPKTLERIARAIETLGYRVVETTIVNDLRDRNRYTIEAIIAPAYEALGGADSTRAPSGASHAHQSEENPIADE